MVVNHSLRDRDDENVTPSTPSHSNSLDGSQRVEHSSSDLDSGRLGRGDRDEG